MRLLTLLTPALAALTLAACEEQSVVEAGAPALGTDAGEAVEPSRMLGDVDISGDVQLNGTEPFWSSSPAAVSPAWASMVGRRASPMTSIR